VLIPDFRSDKMPERDLVELFSSGAFDGEHFLPVTYGPMGHSVAWLLKRSDTRLLLGGGEMEYGEKRARETGETPLVYSAQEFHSLLKRSDRPDVVYVTRATRGIPIWFNVYPHWRLVRRSMQILVFPPALPAR